MIFHQHNSYNQKDRQQQVLDSAETLDLHEWLVYM